MMLLAAPHSVWFRIAGGVFLFVCFGVCLLVCLGGVCV